MEKFLRIEKIVADGYGLAREDGEVYLIKRVLPGELVKIIQSERKKGVNFVRSFEIVEESEVRRQPECSYHGICGGCDFQHIPYEEQLRIKGRILRETLMRIGKVQIDHLSGIMYSDEWAYRFRARLHVEKRSVGFKKEESYEIVKIEECPVLKKSLNSMMAGLSKIMKGLGPDNEFADSLNAVEIRTDLRETRSGILFIAPTGKGLSEASKRIVSELKDLFEEIGIWISYSRSTVPGKGFKVIDGPERLYSSYDALSFGFSPLSFFQPNLELAMEVYKKIVSLLESNGSKRVLDLFCGAGLLEVFASGRYEFLGVEENRYAVEDAKINSFLNEVNAEFIINDARKLDRIDEVDTVVLNPPYKGAGEKLTRVISDARSVSKVIYLSCNPATLARDLYLLIENGGFTLREVFLIDFYPQTAHIEVLSLLLR
jgi:23S rRNA (uracil1939-C5)-methyltransferase